MPPTTNRTQRKRPGDLTGVRGQTLAAEAALDKAEAKAQVADAREQERIEKLNTVVDYSTPSLVVAQNSVEGVDGEVVIEDVVIENPKRRIRVNYPVQDMTFGREVLSLGEIDEKTGLMVRAPILGGLRTFSFEEGRYYIVDTDVADHLAFLGYIYE